MAETLVRLIESPLFALFVSLLLAAFAMTGRFSHRIANLLLVATAIVGSLTMVRIGIRDWRVIVGGSMIVVGCCFLASYWVSPPKSIVAPVTSAPSDQRHPAEVARESLEFHTFIAPDHVERTLIGGIEWRKEFTDVRLHITNLRDFDLENVDFLVRFDTEIAKAAQVSEIPDVNLLAISSDPPGVVYSSLKYKDASGKDIEEEPAFTAIAVPAYRVLCKRLLRGHPLRIVFATAALETEEKGGLSLTAIDRFAYPRKRPTTMQISGVYKATNTDGKRIHHDIGTGTFKY